jgi:CheY-like chemotaxis protein
MEALGEASGYPDLVVADYRLARGECGTDVIARLRSELGSAVPALLISGDSSAVRLGEDSGSGCEVLIKPVVPKDLKSASNRLLLRLAHHRSDLMQS